MAQRRACLLPPGKTKGPGLSPAYPLVLSWTVALLLFLTALFACQRAPRVIIVGREGDKFSVRVEIADTPAKRNLGLMYRRELSEDQGMLFLFPDERVRSFWMKNTPLSLDLIFIGARRRVVGIIRRAVPFSTASLSVSAPSRFVLEVRGGLARSKGIEVGDTVRFEGVPLQGARE